MNKNLLIKNVADRLGVQSSEVQIVVNTFLDCLTESLQKEENVVVRGFGSFRIHHQTERPVRNVVTNEPCMLTQRNTVKFVVGKELFERINRQEDNIY